MLSGRRCLFDQTNLDNPQSSAAVFRTGRRRHWRLCSLHGNQSVLPAGKRCRFACLADKAAIFWLILPLVMVFVCALWFYLIRRNTVLAGVRAAEDAAALSRQKALSRDCRTASMMFWSVGLGFLQLDALNMAKQMQGFGLFVPLVCLIAMVIVSIRYRLKLRGLAHAGGRLH